MNLPTHRSAMLHSATAALICLACLLAVVGPAPADDTDETLWDALNAAPPTSANNAGGAASASQPRPDAGSASSGSSHTSLRNPFGFLNGLQKWLRHVGTVTRSDLKITGQHNLRYHAESISGSRDSYDNSTYYGRRSLGGGYTDTDVTISGKILGLVSFETRYSDNMYGNPYDNRVKLSYASRGFSLEAGDIQAGITGNSLVDFTRSLTGITMSANVAPGVKVSTLYSQEKAQTRTIVINGANRSGPYYVFAGQVVDGSARVRVNNRDLILGQDYTMDPYTGELNFLNGLIVHELDTIAVTFETYGYNQSPGLLTGWRADVTALKPARFGVTYLTQAENRSGSRNATKTEQFYGYNSAAAPYVLEMPVEVTLIRDEDGKITGCVPVYPMTVTVSGLPQAYGTDYVLDPLLPNRVYFKMAIPSTQIIRIIYRPAAADASSGDRSVVGLDVTTSLGKLGTITAEMARSSLSLTGQGAGGSAWQIRSDMKFPGNKLRLNWTVKNIGSNFTAIQSPGFRRNDRGISLGADYEISPKLKVNATVERSKRPAYSYSTTAGSSGLAQAAAIDDFSLTTLRANWQLPRGGTLSYTRNSMGTRMGLGGNSVHETDTLTYQQSLGQFNLDFSLGRQHASTSARYSTGGNADPQIAAFGSDSLNARIGARWRLGEKLSFDTILTNSSIKSADGKSNNAQDITLNARAMPMRNLTLTIGYQNQTSGGYSLFSGYTDYTGGSSSLGPASVTRQVGSIGSIGFPGSGLSGYYGGGVNGGLGTYGNYSGGFGSGGYGLGTASFGGNSRGLNITANYQPFPTLSFDVNWSNGSSVGDYLFNSRRNSLSLSANYNPGERLSIVGGILTQNVAYIGSEGGTSTSGLYLNATSRPWGKLMASMNYNVMRSSTKSSTQSQDQTGGSYGGYYGGAYGGYFGSGSTNLSAYGLRLEYPAWLGSNLFAQYDSADSTGFLAAIQRTFSVGFVFDLGNNMQFQIGWRDQKYQSRANTGSTDYSYHVRSLDADIGLRF